jgi:hypothetical protein
MVFFWGFWFLSWSFFGVFSLGYFCSLLIIIINLNLNLNTNHNLTLTLTLAARTTRPRLPLRLRVCVHFMLPDATQLRVHLLAGHLRVRFLHLWPVLLLPEDPRARLLRLVLRHRSLRPRCLRSLRRCLLGLRHLGSAIRDGRHRLLHVELVLRRKRLHDGVRVLIDHRLDRGLNLRAHRHRVSVCWLISNYLMQKRISTFFFRIISSLFFKNAKKVFNFFLVYMKSRLEICRKRNQLFSYLSLFYVYKISLL